MNWAAKGQSISTMLYIEPDKFKNIKDTLGIAGSDLVLSDMANLLRENAGDKAILARFAGTIFTILLPEANGDSANQVAERIRNAFENHIFDVEGTTVSTTCSIGVIPITETTPDAKKALNHADAACAKAKSGNGNSIHVHTVADQLASLEVERAWSERIRIALAENGGGTIGRGAAAMCIHILEKTK